MRNELGNGIVDERLGNFLVRNFDLADVHHLEELRIVELHIAKQRLVDAIQVELTRRVTNVRLLKVCKHNFLVAAATTTAIRIDARRRGAA